MLFRTLKLIVRNAVHRLEACDSLGCSVMFWCH